MAREWCPGCREIRNMRVSVSERTEKGREGKPKRIRTLLFHCETCYRFVRSEEHEVQATDKGG
jgi:hypothetical protein